MFLLLTLAAVLLTPSDRDLLDHVRLKVLDTLNRLPRYVCTENLERAELRFPPGSHPPKRQLTFSDKLRLDVSIIDKKETYSWVGANQFSQDSLSTLVGGGATSTGWFGTFLVAIFQIDRPDFSSAGTIVRNGQSVRQIDYRVPVERSHYVLGRRETMKATAYQGSLLLNPQTEELMGLTANAVNPPRESGILNVADTLDYQPVQVRGSTFLLPSEARMELVDDDDLEAHNHVTYSNCHEFVGESTLHFEDVPSTGNVSLTLNQPLDIKPREFFGTVLTQNLDTSQAAAGDAIALRTTSTIKTRVKNSIIPKGSLLTARIIRLQFTYGRDAGMSMVIRFEDPTKLTAMATSINGRRAPFTLTDDGSTATINIKRAAPGYILKKGFSISWVTVLPETHR